MEPVHEVAKREKELDALREVEVVPTIKQPPIVSITVGYSARYLFGIDASTVSIWRRSIWLIKFPWFIIEFIIKGELNYDLP